MMGERFLAPVLFSYSKDAYSPDTAPDFGANAMAAATAACGCTAPVTVRDRTCIEKSYPRFWTDLSALKTVPAAENTELE